MEDFFKNKIKFEVEKEGKSKSLVVIPFKKIEEIEKTTSWNYLDKNLKNLINKILPKIKYYDSYLSFNDFGDFLLIKKQENNLRGLIYTFRKIFKFLKDNKVSEFSIYINDFLNEDLKIDYTSSLMVMNFLLANFDFSRYYKNPPKEGWFEIKKITIHSPTKYIDEVKKGVREGITIGEEINRARFLSNLPGGDLTPSLMVDIIKRTVKNYDIKIKILEKKDLEKIKAGGLLKVSKGAKEPPYLVILEIPNKGKELHFIGKGITFDTGGLQIKPSEHMIDMHLDMSGAASVFASTILIKRLGINVNLKTIIPLAENMPGSEAYRPGDIVRTISGKTIEIGSTDAEGRIILADAIDYSKKFFKPKLIVELSTLTGASMIALGTRFSAIFTNNKKLQEVFLELGEKTGDHLWPLPLLEDYKKDIEANFADVLNIGKSKYGGAIHGAIFLWEFAKPVDFVHIDIAPRMVSDGNDYLNKGSTGFGVNLLKEFSKNFNNLDF